DKTTIRDIAEKADVSTGAVYMHFTGKPDIMAVLLSQILLSYGKGFIKALSSAKTGIVGIERYIDHFFHLVREPKFVTYLHHIKRLKSGEVECAVGDSLKDRAKEFHMRLRDTIARGQEDGSVKKLDSPDMMSLILMYILGGVGREMTENSVSRLPEHLPQVSADMLLELLKKMVIASFSEGLPPPDSLKKPRRVSAGRLSGKKTKKS
ncbi:MAG: TetR/AcrR family transcriptional regulator, partial [Spirochaetales bacterium]|nr:TetR/AcrR family transcriptional regulator [Spirochaetales bacterium]